MRRYNYICTALISILVKRTEILIRATTKLIINTFFVYKGINVTDYFLSIYKTNDMYILSDLIGDLDFTYNLYCLYSESRLLVSNLVEYFICATQF